MHLHLHTEYSLLDGGNRIDRLVARVKELGMESVAVTDHGNMHGAVSFYEKAKAAGIKPILGVEAYVAPGDRTSREYTGVSDGGYHLVLLAENEQGWSNLLHLCSQAYLTGFYFKPRMDREILERCNSGLIAINGHLGSELGEHLLAYARNHDKSCWDKAIEAARWHERVFADEGTGPRFYVELQSHVDEQDLINPHLVRLARELELPLVCDNDAHFLKAEDHDAHDTLICISMGKNKKDEDRLRYTPELYVKSPEQMWELFEGTHDGAGTEALENTARIGERCNVELPIGANHAPQVRVRIPDELPKHDEDRFNGDLTAWYKAYCASFDLEPFDSTEEGVDENAVKEACDRALRMLGEAGMVWRYGPSILDAKPTDQPNDGPGEATDVDGEGRNPPPGPSSLDGAKWARLERELGILADKYISAYFLIVWDFVNWGRQRGIPANARGSGVGTMVGYVLGLSNACPVEYGLLFERFTDPDRTEYPDIDIDLCQDGRAEVIEYVRQKYGHVAQIITFGTLKARAAVRDIARVMAISLPAADRIAKTIPDQLNITFDKAIETEPDFKALYEGKPAALAKINDKLAPHDQVDASEIRQLVDTGRVLEGQARHASVHAAGVIVATRPLDEIVPLYKATGAGEQEIVTQWDGPTCEKMGLLKMDFLGLRTLSTIERAKALIGEGLDDDAVYRAVGREKGHGGPHPLDLERLTYDDPMVFALFQRGDTTGVFQFESGGMRRLLNEMKPDRLEDLIAANALFRPGPMDLIPDYNRRKHGKDRVPSVHPIVDKFTNETYGVMVYQEQVMQIVHELGGIPLRAAYSLIKAISKKKKAVIDANRPKFIEGAFEQGLARDKADELFELILKFAGYGFNKSHSTGYAILAYQTAYLKTYFPNQYMASFLSFESQAQKVSDWIPYLDDCRRTRFIDPKTGQTIKVGVEVRPPDVNLSQSDFSVVFDKKEQREAHGGHVRFGMRAIKGAGAKAIEAIIRERDGIDSGIRDQGSGISGQKKQEKAKKKPFGSLFEFCERVPSGVVNKATIESLIRSGAFDPMHGRDERASMMATVPSAMSAGQKAAQDKAAGQERLFGFGGPEEDESGDAPEVTLVKVTPWTESELLRQEKDALGFYVSSHPLEEWRPWAETFATCDVESLKERKQDARVVVPAIVSSVRTLVGRQGRGAGRKMAILTIEDLTGSADAVLFADGYEKYGHLLEEDDPKFVLGRVDHSRGDAQIIVDRLVPIDGVPLEKGTLRVIVRAGELNGSGEEVVRHAGNIVRAHIAEGKTRKVAVPYDVVVDMDECAVTLKPEGARRVVLEPQLVRELTGVLGARCTQLVGGVTVDLEKNKGRRRTG